MAILKSFELNGKYGFKDTEQRVIVPPKYDTAVRCFGTDPTSHRICPKYGSVSLNGKCGVINESGDIIVPIIYDDAYPVFGDFFAVRKNDDVQKRAWQFGLINSNGVVVIPFEYRLIRAYGSFIQCCREAASKHNTSSSGMDFRGSVYDYWALKKETWFNASLKIIHEGPGIEAENGFLVVEQHEKDYSSYTSWSESMLLGLKNDIGRLILPYEYSEIHCVTPKRIIARKDTDFHWRFGLYSSDGDELIPFVYKHIALKDGAFFDCRKYCSCEDNINNKTDNDRFLYDKQGHECWHNLDGQFIYEGYGTVLNANLLAVNKSGYWGVINQRLQKVINFEYDEIRCIDEALIVGKDGKMGILDFSGRIIISCSYTSIEHVVFSKDYYPSNRLFHSDELYGDYNINHAFDSDHPASQLFRSRLLYLTGPTERSYFKFEHLCFSFIPESDSFFILSTEQSSVIFTIKEGIVEHSESQQIFPITEQHYVVMRNSKWGIFNVKTKRIVIKCQYDRILYQGGDAVILYKGDLQSKETLA